MKIENQYLKFVLWSEDDHQFVGYCPDLFPWGGVCHSAGEEDAYHALCELVREEISALLNDGKPLPAPGTRPMREAVLA